MFTEPTVWAASAGLAIGVLTESAVTDAMRIFDQRNGFPALPNSSRLLLLSESASASIALEMEKAIRAAISKLETIRQPGAKIRSGFNPSGSFFR